MQLACIYKWCISSYLLLLLKYRDFIWFAFLSFLSPCVLSGRNDHPYNFKSSFPSPSPAPHNFNTASCTVCLKTPCIVSAGPIFLGNRFEISPGPTRLPSACHGWGWGINSRWGGISQWQDSNCSWDMWTLKNERNYWVW